MIFSVFSDAVDHIQTYYVFRVFRSIDPPCKEKKDVSI